MNHGGRIISIMAELINLFRGRCTDTAVLDALAVIVQDRAKWVQGRSIFQQTRERHRRANRDGDGKRRAQCDFEEVCGKTLYNISSSGAAAPYDADSPFWVVPNALTLARALGIDSEVVVAIASPNRAER